VMSEIQYTGETQDEFGIKLPGVIIQVQKRHLITSFS